MIIHLAGSIRDIEADSKYLREIIDIISNTGGAIARNWVEPAILRQKEKIYLQNWKPYVDSSLEAIERSDLVIIETTYYSFNTGFQMGAALDHKKPTLLVSREPLNGKLVSGITDPLLTQKTYTTSEELEKIVQKFIEQNTVHTKDLRFNIFLTRTIFKYLSETSQKTNKNKSEIIREIIRKKAEK